MAQIEDFPHEKRIWIDEAVHETLACMATQASMAERVQAIAEAGKFEAVYKMVQLALKTKAFVLVPRGSSESAQTEMAFRSIRAEIATTLGRSERGADLLIGHAIALHEFLPTTLSALREGEITSYQASIIIAEATPLTQELDAVAEFDREMAERAREVPASKLRRVARKLRDRLYPVPIAERFANAASERRVWVEDADDGMAWLHLYLPVVEAHLIFDRADNIARAQLQSEREAAQTDAAQTDAAEQDCVEKDAVEHGAGIDPSAGSDPQAGPSAGSDPQADPGAGIGIGIGFGNDFNASDQTWQCPDVGLRTLVQVRTDVVRDLLLENCPENLPIPAGGGMKTSVRITIPALGLLGLSDEPATLDGYGPIDMETARHVAAQNPSLQRLLTHPITGSVLSIDPDVYTVPVALRRWLELRDVTCRFPGCNASVARAEADHTIAWEHGGRTSHDNLGFLCVRHHKLKHATAWGVDQLPEGVFRWVSPLGRIHYTLPETEMVTELPPRSIITDPWGIKPDSAESAEAEPLPF